MSARKTPGIEVRHRQGCTPGTGRCNCKPSYRAEVFDTVTGRKIRKTLPTLTAARSWRTDAASQLQRGTRRGPTGLTIRQAASEWLDDADAGIVTNRSGHRYKPSVLHSYRQALQGPTSRIDRSLGAMALEDLTTPRLQAFIDGMQRDGLSASTVRNTLMPLRVIYGRAVANEDIGRSPFDAAKVPADRRRRVRIADPAEAAQLIEAVPAHDRPIWSAVMYSGLRLGEVLALRWEDVDLATGVIRVRRSWDYRTRSEGLPKSSAGIRTVPLIGALRDVLVELKMAGDPGGLVFPGGSSGHFDHSSVRQRAKAAWKGAGLDPIGFHECRHTFASVMIAAGVDPKALSTYMGHSTISTTYDIYGHLLPGEEAEAARRIDAFMERSNTAARIAAVAA